MCRYKEDADRLLHEATFDKYSLPIYHLFPFLARQIQAKSLRNSLAMLKILICFVLVILVSMFRFPENQVKLYRTQCLKSYPQIFDLPPVM